MIEEVMVVIRAVIQQLMNCSNILAVNAISSVPGGNIICGLIVVLEMIGKDILIIPVIVETISLLILHQTTAGEVLMDHQGLIRVTKRQI